MRALQNQGFIREPDKLSLIKTNASLQQADSGLYEIKLMTGLLFCAFNPGNKIGMQFLSEAQALAAGEETGAQLGSLIDALNVSLKSLDECLELKGSVGNGQLSLGAYTLLPKVSAAIPGLWPGQVRTYWLRTHGTILDSFMRYDEACEVLKMAAVAAGGLKGAQRIIALADIASVQQENQPRDAPQTIARTRFASELPKLRMVDA